MEYKLLGSQLENAKARIFENRNIVNIEHFLYSKDEDINSPLAFGKELLIKGASLLINCIRDNKKAFIIVDSDVDGFSSSALLINYLYDLFPAWVNNNLSWGFHEGKQHGLADFINVLATESYGLVICPDSSSNDLKEIEILHKNNIDVLILDHHECDNFSEYAVTINSQYNYPNGQLSGAGVVYQFCRFLDNLLDVNYADNYLDLCAYGLQSDMMDIRCLETKQLIFQGLKEENIKNPFIGYMTEKHEFSLNKADYKPSSNNGLFITPIGMSFFLTPFGNAICRSGTMEEKELIFNSMLKFKAFEVIPSTKRGHDPGETEKLITQAVRTATNVKNRQEREVTAGLEFIELLIKKDNLLDNKVLVIVLQQHEIASGIAGLIANKLMAKYQRPTCIITQFVDEDDGNKIKWAGSMRGYTATGIKSFKEIAETSDACEWCRGHANAAGICINNPKQFTEDMNKALNDFSTEIVYYVDYIWDTHTVDEQAILDIAEMNDYIGTGFERPYVCVKDIPVNKDTFVVMKSNTLKFKLGAVDMIKFGGTEEEIEMFNTEKGVLINAICKCAKNEWNGNKYPQLVVVDYQIKPVKTWIF